MSYAQGMMEPVRWIIDSISDLITTQVNIERLSKLLETKSDVVDSPEVIKKYGVQQINLAGHSVLNCDF
jgi:ATP-binding cassette subfamily B protein